VDTICFRWRLFPEAKRYLIISDIRIRVLWVGGRRWSDEESRGCREGGRVWDIQIIPRVSEGDCVLICVSVCA